MLSVFCLVFSNSFLNLQKYLVFLIVFQLIQKKLKPAFARAVLDYGGVKGGDYHY